MKKIIGLALVFVLFCSSVSMAACVKPPVFPIFDSMGYSGKPADMVGLGFKELGLMGEIQFADKLTANTNRVPKKADVEYVMCTAGRFNNRVQVKVFDLEQWKIRETDSHAKYEYVIALANAYEPDKTVGFFETVPQNIRWNDFLNGWQDPNSPELIEFRALNDLRQNVADQVDALFPSIYTSTTDMALWKEYAVLMLDEAKRLANGKPVYAFMLPQYLPITAGQNEAFLSGANWRQQLEFVRNHADGIVIWGYYNKPMSQTDEWWLQTLAFIQSLGGGI